MADKELNKNINVSVLITAMQDAADKAHDLMGSFEAAKHLEQSGHKMPQPMYDGFTKKLTTAEQKSALCAEIFEILVTAMAQAGVPGCTVRQCKAEDLKPYDGYEVPHDDIEEAP